MFVSLCIHPNMGGGHRVMDEIDQEVPIASDQAWSISAVQAPAFQYWKAILIECPVVSNLAGCVAATEPDRLVPHKPWLSSTGSNPYRVSGSEQPVWLCSCNRVF